MLALHRKLAELEAEPGPLEPLAPDNSISYAPYDMRLHVLKTPAQAEFLAGLYAATNELAFEMIAATRAGRSKFDLALDLMFATAHAFCAYPEDPRITSGFVSFRSHAEAFIANAGDRDGTRAHHQRQYARFQQALVARVRVVVDTLDDEGALVPFVQEWTALLRPFVHRAGSLISSGELVLPQSGSDEPGVRGWTGDWVRHSPLHQMINSSASHLTMIFDTPWFIQYRIMINFLYLHLNRLGVTPVERFLLCHLAANTGIVAKARDSLAAAGVTAEVYDGVRSHPDLAAVREAFAAAAEVDLVVGLGGGSSMDVAKVAAAAVGNPEFLDPATWEIRQAMYVPRLARPRAGLPLVLAPATAATGAEVTCKASLRTDGDGAKRLLFHPLLYAQLALVDPALTVSVPPSQVAEGLLETLLRVLVPYLTQPAGAPISADPRDRLVEGVIETLLDQAPAMLATPVDPQARAVLSYLVLTTATSWATAGWHPYGFCLWHLENGLGSLRGIPKGSGFAALLPTYLDLVVDRGERVPRLGRPARLAKLGRRALSLADDAATPRAAARLLAKRVHAFGLPGSLTELGFTAADIPTLIDQTLRDWGSTALDWLDRDDLAALYWGALRPQETHRLPTS